jgi:two-component system chemotaxis sensor kinase CheA
LPLSKGQNIKISIKAKILGSVFLLLLITVTSNLLYSYKLFMDDKTSYLYEIGLKQAESLDDQVNLKIQELVTFVKILKKPTISINDIQDIVSDSDDLYAIGEVDSTGKVLKIINNHQFEDHKPVIESYIMGIDNLNPRKQVLNEISLVQLNPTTKGYLYFTKLREDSFSFFIATADSFNNLYLNTNTIFTNAKINLKGTVKEYGDLSKIINNFPAHKGTIQYEKLLVSFVKSKDSSLATICYIELDKAFHVTYLLILKTILFGGVLLGVLISIGTILSANLTKPIENLTSLASGIANGDFSHRFQVSTNDEIAVLGRAFNQMSSEISSLISIKEKNIKELGTVNLKLEDYGKSLSLMVEKRTHELKVSHRFIQAMVNSLDQGLVVFDKELICNKVHTVVSEKIFGISPVGVPFYTLVGKTLDNEINHVKDWSKILFSELIPFESAAALGPTTLITGKNFRDLNFKQVNLDYYPMRNDDNKVENIVVVATDMTKEIQSNEKTKAEQAFAKMILKILQNKNQFQLFIDEVEKIFSSLRICNNTENDSFDLESAMLYFHTLNGGFGLYQLYDLQLLAREHESTLVLSRTDSNALSQLKEQYSFIVEDFYRKWKKEVFDLDEILMTRFSQGVVAKEIEISDIQKVKKNIDNIGNDELSKLYYNAFIYEPIEDYLRPYSDLVANLATKTGKKIHPLKIENGGLRIDPLPLNVFFNVLVHLFRNCVDHGIEVESSRMNKNKSPDGSIIINCNIIKEKIPQLILSIRDDGAGIDPDIIKKRLKLNNPNESSVYDSLTDKELILKIFDPFFTTRNEVTALSGRGVGMSAIKEVVDELGGSIEVESFVGKGTNFIFYLPLHGHKS